MKDASNTTAHNGTSDEIRVCLHLRDRFIISYSGYETCQEESKKLYSREEEGTGHCQCADCQRDHTSYKRSVLDDDEGATEEWIEHYEG